MTDPIDAIGCRDMDSDCFYKNAIALIWEEYPDLKIGKHEEELIRSYMAASDEPGQNNYQSARKALEELFEKTQPSNPATINRLLYQIYNGIDPLGRSILPVY